MKIFKGILYKSNFFYNLLDYLKNRNKRNLRFKILNKYITNNSTLIDVCGGCGWLKDHISKSIDYTVSDASTDFKNVCNDKKINFIDLNFNKNRKVLRKFDFVVMIISFYQFRSNYKKVIKILKKISKKKIIIIEEVSPKNESNYFKNFKKNLRGYLCNVDFYKKNNDLFNFDEFANIMKKSGFKIENKFTKYNLAVGIFKIK